LIKFILIFVFIFVYLISSVNNHNHFIIMLISKDSNFLKHATVIGDGYINSHLLDFLKSNKVLFTQMKNKKGFPDSHVTKNILLKNNEIFFSDGSKAVLAKPVFPLNEGFCFRLSTSLISEIIRYGTCYYQFLEETHTQCLFEELAKDKEKTTKYYLMLNNYSGQKMVLNLSIDTTDYDFIFKDVEKKIACEVSLPLDQLTKFTQKLPKKEKDDAKIVISPQGIYGWTGDNDLDNIHFLKADCVPLATQFFIRDLICLQKNTVSITHFLKIYQRATIPFQVEIFILDVSLGYGEFVNKDEDIVQVCEFRKKYWSDILDKKSIKNAQAA